MYIEVYRIMETGSKTLVNVNPNHIVCVQNYFRPGIEAPELKKLQEETCVVMLSNGVVMHLEISKNILREKM